MAAHRIPGDSGGIPPSAGSTPAGAHSPASTVSTRVTSGQQAGHPAAGTGVHRHSAGDGQLSAFTDATHGAVLQVLGGGEPESGYMAIARLSAHLAAMQRTVFVATGRRHGGDRGLPGTWLSRARDVEWALRLFECRLAGDMFAAPLPAEVVYQHLEQCLRSYRAAERALVSRAEERLSPADCERLAAEYRAALTRAPTRPHPHGPHTGPLARLAFGMHGAWDRILDGVDSRPGVGWQFLVPAWHPGAGVGGAADDGPGGSMPPPHGTS